MAGSRSEELRAPTTTRREAFLLLWIAGFLRVALIVYGEWQDAHMEVPYTDVDYNVFSEAAAFMYVGRSPYSRATYRYSPLLAFLLLPNVWLHPSWGKFLFAAADLLVGYLLHKLLQLQGVIDSHILYLSAWLFNPYTFTIGTRGNCEALVCAMVLWFLICLKSGRLMEAAVWYGVTVHFRIYPIIYVLPVLLLLKDDYLKVPKSADCSTITSQAAENNKPVHGFQSTFQHANDGQNICMLSREKPKPMLTHFGCTLHCLNRYRIGFSLISGGVFLLLTGICYKFYGLIFLQEAFFYHLTRTDPRHNFSIYFLSIYLHQNSAFSVFERIVAFIPQMFMQVVLSAYFFEDITFCLFLQTVSFVAFNKVITAQYFVWFFCLLPLILPRVSLNFKWKGALCMCIWTGAQLHWLAWAYLLEFQGMNVFFQLWLASILFFAANIFIMAELILSYSRNHTEFHRSSFSTPGDHRKSD